MKYFLKSIVYLLHPLLMPLFGVLIYFLIAPRFTADHTLLSSVLGLLIVTVITPIVLVFFLKNLGFVSAISLPAIEDRRIPLLLQIGLYILTTKTLINIYDFPELYYFFAGTLFATMLALVSILLRFNVSIHMIGIAIVTTFTIALSIHFSINQIFLIAGLFLLNGLIATAILAHSTHSLKELAVGLLIGAIPQMALFQLWI